MSNTYSWEVLSAISTIVGALVAILALFVAVPMLAEAKRARRVTLSITLSERFSSDEMHEALAYLGRRRDQHNKNIAAMCDAYVIEANEATKQAVVSEWGRYRRAVSKFFISSYAQFEADLLDPKVFASQIGRASIELYVQVVAALDETQAVRVLGRNDYLDRNVRDFFSVFLAREFGHE